MSLQIGLDSGSVVETILGRRLLPRWKLFGDTVNTASRMKKHGRPGRVAFSSECAKLLYNRDGGRPVGGPPSPLDASSGRSSRYVLGQTPENPLGEPPAEVGTADTRLVELLGVTVTCRVRCATFFPWCVRACSIWGVRCGRC